MCGKLKVAGIDLSGPRNVTDTCMAVFEVRENELHYMEAVEGAGDAQLFQVLSSTSNDERVVVGIDAPLSYNPGGGDRPSDKELRQLVSGKGRVVGVMPPTMIRMVYLTLRGVALSRMLETLKPRIQIEIVEVHPGACMLLRDAPRDDVRKFKKDRPARLHLCDWLGTQGLKSLPRSETLTDHFVAACAAALGAWGWAQGKSVWRFAAQPPGHPYDFAC